MIVVFIHGPAASGKHTIGVQLAARTGLPLFHNHLTVDLVRTLFPFGSEGFVRLRAAIWRASFAGAVAARQSFIFTFHPEATVDPRLIEDLRLAVESGGGRMHFIELTCSNGTILQRLGNASRARFGKLTDADLYRRIEQDGGFRFPPLPQPRLRIDTDRTTAGQAAFQIAEALEIETDG